MSTNVKLYAAVSLVIIYIGVILYLTGCIDVPPRGTFIERCAEGDDAACRYLQLTPEEAAAYRD